VVGSSCHGQGCAVEPFILDWVRIPRALWRRCRLWKISRYSKIALASSMRVRHRLRSSSSVCMRPRTSPSCRCRSSPRWSPSTAPAPSYAYDWIKATVQRLADRSLTRATPRDTGSIGYAWSRTTVQRLAGRPFSPRTPLIRTLPRCWPYSPRTSGALNSASTS